MNCVYRLVWNRALDVVQVAPEHARGHGGASGRFTARALRRHPLALAVATLALASMSAPAWGQTSCTASTPSGCAASGGQGGHPGRNNNGGSGNGTGGDALVFNPNSSEIPGGSASNGTGGNGADGALGGVTSAGGGGGAVGATGSAGVNASISGGIGGTGEAAPAGSSVSGGGGGGGAGLFINDGNSLPTSAATTVIDGGQGGQGGQANAVSNADPGSGGGGGAAVIIGAGAGSVTLTNNGRLAGGAGGAGGSGGYAGSGGGGGDGLLVLGAGAGITNHAGANIAGGAGGTPGVFQDGQGQAGGYGSGGVGVNLVGGGASLINGGTITGGSAGVSPANSGQSGDPGVGVRAWGGDAVINDGVIAGGNNGAGVQADSVLFSGGGNQLLIDGGATFTGNIVSTSGTTNGGDMLTLGGNTAGTINAGLIVGFANNIKAGNSTWTLTGAGNGGINWTVEQGQLIGDASTFGGNLTFASSGVGMPSIEFNQTATGTFSGQIGGQGELVKAGAGGLTLSGDLSTFSGQFAINQGNVVLTGTGDVHGAEVSGAAMTLDVSGISGPSANFAGLSGNGSVTLGTHTLVLENPANDVFNGTIGGGGGLTINGGTETLTGINTYSGDTTVNAGALKLTGGAQIGQGQSRAVVDSALDVSGLTAGSTLALRSLSGAGAVTLGANNLSIANGSDTFSGAIGGRGGLTINGGTETLTGINTYSGDTTVNAGALKLTGGAQIGQGQSRAVVDSALDVSGLTAGSTLALRSLSGNGTVTLGANNLSIANGSDTFSGAIGGSGGLTINGGTETLTGINTYTGDTLVDDGTLTFGTSGQISGSRVQIGSGTLDVSGKMAGGSLRIVSLAGSGNVSLGDAGLTLGNAADTYGGVIAGAGTITVGSGREVFNGVNTYTGLTAISSGATLLVGDSGHATAQVRGDVTVAGGTLGGFGAVLGDVTVSNGGTLAAGDVGSVGALTVNGNLTVGTGSKLAFDFGAPGPTFSTPGQSDHVVVNGNLSIGNSTLNVSNLGSMGPGLYNLFDWGGSLGITGGGFAPPAGMTLQVLSADKQINLIDTQGLTLNQWDANGRASANAMGGGSGTWSVASNNWANTSGESVGPMTPQPSFAIFGGTAGTVMVDNSSGAVSATGLQFTSDGYHLVGDTVTLLGQSGVAPVVRVSSGATATVDNVLSGTSGLNKTDGGLLVLNGNNLYQGTTTLSGGYLSVSSDANLGQNANALDFEGGTLKITGTSFNQTARNIVWGSAGGGFDIDNATNTFTLAQTLNGAGGLLKSGAGTLLLNGRNTYSGGTIVSGGTLEVGDADHLSASVAGDVQVNATGTLSGHGTVAGSIANNGGTVSPGGSIGTLSVGGNYTQASNGVLAVEVSPTAASQLNVAGAATLNGVLAITYDPGTYTAKQYTLVAAGQGVSGQFSGVTKTVSSGADLGSLQQNVTYSANQVALDLADASVGSTSPTGPTGPVVIAPTGISIYTALGSSVSMGSQTANSTLLARMNRVSAATAGAPDGWIDATGAQTHVGGANGEPGYQANRYGFLAGLDSRVGDYTLGVATGYAHTDVDEQQTGDSATADTLRVALYGSRWFGPVGVSATAGYALDFLSQKRPFGALGTAEGDHVGHEFTAAGQASMPLTFGSIVVTPSMGMRYAYFHANGFDESGAGGQDLDVGTDKVQSLQPYAQVTFDKAFGDALRPVDLQMRVGYAHEVLNANRAMSVTAQDGTVFSAPGTSLPRGYLTAGVSLRMEPTKAMSVSIAYDTLINTTHASAQAASLKLGYKF